MPINFEVVKTLEDEIADFFGSPYAVAVDSCTHGIELALRYTNAKKIVVPKRTYLSIPFLANKLAIDLKWSDEEWTQYYFVTTRIVDAAVHWKKDGYIFGTMMCLSFQFQKHLSLGRGGMILCDSEEDAMMLKKMSYDGRLPNIPWREQNIDTMGYHYYMTPETAQMGLDKLPRAIKVTPRNWDWRDYPDLTKMNIFIK